MSKTSCPVGVWTSIACSALWQETTYLSVSIRFSEWKLVTAPSRQIDMRLKTIKRWGEWKHLRDSTSTIPHVCPVFFNPYSLIIHFQTQPNPSPHIYMHTMCSNLLCLIYPSTFPHSFPYILNQALPCPPSSLFGYGSQLGSVEAKSSTGRLTPSCRWSVLLPEHLLRPFSFWKAQHHSFTQHGRAKQRQENRFNKHITRWIWRLF